MALAEANLLGKTTVHSRFLLWSGLESKRLLFIFVDKA
jgi:hypothetical protein